ncbi:alcohol dehydrogenase catalytic domain-containing protein [candidate division KSB1 bacterium]|nr:alcohol dehydrogenase catalytic domain-containing protein [candidate division KSB1 bacterium]
MKAAVFEKKLTLQAVPEPVRDDNEALVRVSMIGICNTDVEIVNGYMGFQGIPGHEFVGIVEAAETASWVGKRVVGEINAGCGECEACRKGMARHCPNRSTLGIYRRNGAFAEKLVLPESNLFEVPQTVPDEIAVFTEPLAAALEILEQTHIVPATPVAVIGDGKLGLLIAQVMQLVGCDVHVFGKARSKLDLAERFGIQTHLVETGIDRRFPVVIEASGNATGFASALALIKPRGTLVLKSTYHGELSFDASGLVINEITVIGSRCGRFGPALRLLAKNLIKTKELISEIFPFDEIEAAFEFAQNSKALKVLLKV